MASKKPTAGNDTLSGTKASETLRGLGGDDNISGGGGNDRVYGGDGADALSGGDGHDFLFGGSGNDSLTGGTGNDTLRGEDGGDALAGGIGDDALTGGAGSDVLTGGSGFDQFEFQDFTHSNGANVDRITDYNSAEQDLITLTNFDANPTAPGYQFWSYLTEPGQFADGGNGQATVTYDATRMITTLTLYNNDGDNAADFILQFNGEHAVADINLDVFDTSTMTFSDALIF